MSFPARRPVVILVRDGWGQNPNPACNDANAIHLAKTPVDDHLMATYPNVLVKTSGNAVGLPEGVMGNSEVGHQNIGAGRLVEQEVMRITGRIRDGSLFENPTLVSAFERAGSSGGNVHIMGLCSDGRVHSDLDHLHAILEMSQKRGFPGSRVFVHAFMDGRDTAPDSGIGYVRNVQEKCALLGLNPVASVCGRFYAMDRDNRWDRVERAYRMLTRGEGEVFPTAQAALRKYYDNPTGPSQFGDEFVLPSIVSNEGFSMQPIRDGDSVIFFNYRGDRPREITKAFVLDQFPYKQVTKDRGEVEMGFDRGKKLDLFYATMSEYESGLPVDVIFGKPEPMQAILGAHVADLGLTQFRCAETEKYPHVTFFFNDYRNEPFPNEDRHLVDSPRDIATYDQKPEMSAPAVTEVALKRIATGEDDLIVLNYANCDMVGHTGSIPAAIAAVETVDAGVGRIVDAVLAAGGSLIVTADHGNCEQMVDPETGNPHTAHTTFDVPLIVVDKELKGAQLRTGGQLSDIGPTALSLMGQPVPDAMTGSTLVEGIGAAK